MGDPLQPGGDERGAEDLGPAEVDTALVGAQPWPSVEPTPTASSRYFVIEEVGRGALGRVMRAYDPTLQREVALKEVRDEVSDFESKARQLREARAMAKLSHPHVVEVYDVEQTDTGALLLVMELVNGCSLRAWLRQRQRHWREVVVAFHGAGRGLAAAHAAGLLHRDFKPANVLVAEATDTPKVTDFGLAEVADERAASSVSRGGIQGTPRYMAPEQHDARALTAAADQYAFCVALWEALCGSPPFSGERIHSDKREGPPPWPASGIPRPIVEAVSRGLSPDPSKRWPSMPALLEALSFDPSQGRSRWLLVVGTLGIGTAVATWASSVADHAGRCTGAQQQLVGIWDEARRVEIEQAILGIEKSYATQVWGRTQQELDRYAHDWAAIHLDTCEATTIRGEQPGEVMDLRMACLSRAAVQLGAVAAELADADADVVQNAHELTRGLPPLQSCSDVDALRRGVRPPRSEEAQAVGEIRERLARAQAARRAGRYRRAQRDVEAAKERLAGIGYAPVRTEVALAEGLVLEELGEYEASEVVLRQALASASKSRQPEHMRDAAAALTILVGLTLRRIEEGLSYARVSTALSADDPRRVASSWANLGGLLRAQGKYDEAAALVRRALSLAEKTPGHDARAAGIRQSLAGILHEQGEYVEAESELRRSLALSRKELGDEHPRVASALHTLAYVVFDQGKYEDAEAIQRRALAISQEALGPEHGDVATAHNSLAVILQKQGNHEQAVAEFRRALAVSERALGHDHPFVSATHDNLGIMLLNQGEYAAAEAEHRLALALTQSRLGPEHPDVATSRENLGIALYLQGKYEQAEVEHRRALALRIGVFDPSHPELAVSRYNLATLLADRGRSVEAVPFAEQAWHRHRRGDVPAAHRAKTAFLLARVLWEARASATERARARKLAHEAIAAYHDAERAAADSGAFDDAIGLVEAWLADHRPR